MDSLDKIKIDIYYCGMIQVEVVISPALLPLYEVKGKAVVVVDVLRATSTICTAIHEGAEAVVAVETIESAMTYRSGNYLLAAERNGYKVDGFDMGNSPFECQDGKVTNKTIVLTTTNGTKCIEAAVKAGANHVLAGSFLNLEATAQWLNQCPDPILILCAGWKDKVNLEDTLYAGALVAKLRQMAELSIDCDTALMAEQLYNQSQSDIIEVLKHSSHYKRLSHLSHEEDMIFCMQNSVFQEVVGLVENQMKKM
jgi:2-phosphosulfolactate phosphatase